MAAICNVLHHVMHQTLAVSAVSVANYSLEIAQPRPKIHAPCLSDSRRQHHRYPPASPLLLLLLSVLFVIGLSASTPFCVTPSCTATNIKNSYCSSGLALISGRHNGRHTFSNAEAPSAQSAFHAQNCTLAHYRSIRHIVKMGPSDRAYDQHSPRHDRAQF